jgi:hypothetical protein
LDYLLRKAEGASILDFAGRTFFNMLRRCAEQQVEAAAVPAHQLSLRRKVGEEAQFELVALPRNHIFPAIP